MNNVKVVIGTVGAIAGTTWKNKNKIVRVGKKVINIVRNKRLSFSITLIVDNLESVDEILLRLDETI